MLRVGLTGNMGSGKSLVAEIFKKLGVSVFHADEEARKLFSEPDICSSIKEYFGDRAFSPSGEIDRKALAGMVFQDSNKLWFLNGLIHPRVREKFDHWCRDHSTENYVLYEAAILFESGHYRAMDRVICVTAPELLRLQRIMSRDGVPESDVRQRLAYQWDESRKTALADFIIKNDETEPVIPQVLNIHRELSAF